MFTHTSDPTRRKDDVWFVNDAYDVHVENSAVTENEDVRFEASMLTSLVNSHGMNNRLVAILHEGDRQRISVYKSMGYAIHTMNGNRSDELMILMAELVDKISQLPPRKLIVVSNNPAFSVLSSVAEQKNVDVSVWVRGSRIPPNFRPYDTRRLEDILPTAIRKSTVVVRLDVENHLIGLHKMGQIPETKQYLDAVRSLIADLGSVASIHASADWKRLRETLGRDYQCEFEENGIRTIYRINIPGKNTNDIALAGNIQEALERNPEANVFVIGTGDADFLPLVDAIHDRGKKAVLIALRGSLSRPLAAAADEVRYLDMLIRTNPVDTRIPIVGVDEDFIITMRLANYLRVKRWKFAYYNRLPDELPRVALEKALEKGMLTRRHPGETNTVAINTEALSGRQIQHFIHWVTRTLRIYLVERGKPYCDTKFLHIGMGYDKGCRELKIGHSWQDSIAWLEAAEQAGLLRKEQRPHPKNNAHMISTWWLVDNTTQNGHEASTIQSEEQDVQTENADSSSSLDQESQQEQEPPKDHESTDEAQSSTSDADRPRNQPREDTGPTKTASQPPSSF